MELSAVKPPTFVWEIVTWLNLIANLASAAFKIYHWAIPDRNRIEIQLMQEVLVMLISSYLKKKLIPVTVNDFWTLK